MNEEQFLELREAYALGVLEENEREAFEAYLTAHPHHQAEVDDLGGLAGMLAYAPPEHEPPPALRARVMEVVEAEGSVAPVVPLRRGRRFSRARDVALAAAAVLLVGLISWNALLQGEVSNLRGEVAETRGEVQEARDQAAQASSQQASGQQTSGPQTLQLSGTWVEQGTQAEVATLDQDRVVLVLEDIPEVPEDRTLQIWVIRDEVPRSGGLLKPSGGVNAAAVSRPLNEGDTIAVTVEPAGGSEQPTTTPVLSREV